MPRLVPASPFQLGPKRAWTGGYPQNQHMDITLQLFVIYRDHSVVQIDVPPTSTIRQIRECCLDRRGKTGKITLGGVPLSETRTVADYGAVILVSTSPLKLDVTFLRWRG